MPMRRIAFTLSLTLLTGAAAGGIALAADEAAPAHPHHATAAGTTAADTDSAAMHALGVLLSRNLGSFQLSDRQLRSVLAGISDGVHHPDAAKAAQAYIPQLQALERANAQAVAEAQARKGEAYIDKVAALPNAHRTASGLVFVPEQPGSGPTPKIGDQVKVEYTGRLTDGTVFDSSSEHGGSAVFPLGRVIPCWDEGMQLLKVGGSARIVCPAKLAYGDRGAGDFIKPGSTLDFDVHLLAILPPAPAAPGGTVPHGVPAPAPAPAH